MSESLSLAQIDRVKSEWAFRMLSVFFSDRVLSSKEADLFGDRLRSKPKLLAPLEGIKLFP